MVAGSEEVHACVEGAGQMQVALGLTWCIYLDPRCGKEESGVILTA